MPYKILLYGLPGAGKDTQAAALSAALGIPWFSAGELLRSEVARWTELGEYVRPYLERGEIAPGAAKIVIRENVLSPEVQASGYILNGYARNRVDLKEFFMDDTPTHAIHLVVPDEVAIDRLIGRRRHDDHPEAIEKRLAHHCKQIDVIRSFFVELGTVPFLDVDGTASPEEVTQAILQLL